MLLFVESESTSRKTFIYLYRAGYRRLYGDCGTIWYPCMWPILVSFLKSMWEITLWMLSGTVRFRVIKLFRFHQTLNILSELLLIVKLWCVSNFLFLSLLKYIKWTTYERPGLWTFNYNICDFSLKSGLGLFVPLKPWVSEMNQDKK